MLSWYGISRKTNDPNSENGEKTHFGTNLGALGPNSGRQFLFSRIWLRQSLDIRYHVQLSSCTISGKTNDQILRKSSDGWTDGLTDRRKGGQTDESDFIGRCPTNVERPIEDLPVLAPTKTSRLELFIEICRFTIRCNVTLK